jgi:hypothetical protein
MNRENDRIRTLLHETFTPIGNDAGPARDLWVSMQRKLRESPGSETARFRIPWFDWVLAIGVAVVAVAFPASIPVILYYL